jgi:hypothetical protein
VKSSVLFEFKLEIKSLGAATEVAQERHRVAMLRKMVNIFVCFSDYKVAVLATITVLQLIVDSILAVSLRSLQTFLARVYVALEFRIEEYSSAGGGDD